MQDFLVLKLLRLQRYTVKNRFEYYLSENLAKWLTRDSSRSEKISTDLTIQTSIQVTKLIFATLIGAYILGLLWYRFSSHWQGLMLETDNKEFYFVNRFDVYVDLNDNESIENYDRFKAIFSTIVLLMYYMLTTLSTVGYGDFFPSSILEKIVGIFIEIVGVSVFSVLMNMFIEIVVHKFKGDDESIAEIQLNHWFKIIKHIKNQPYKGSKDITYELKKKIEAHFKYFWMNDRNSVLLEKHEYFEAIPHTIQSNIVTNFLFKDILRNKGFLSFFESNSD